MHQTYISIGTSAAGLAATSRLRELDPHSRIICISDESEYPYNRCRLASYVAGAKQEATLYTREKDFFTRTNIELWLNTRVTHINAIQKYIQLADGTLTPYTKLFIGVGCHAHVPELYQPLLYKTIFPFHGLADIQKLLTHIDQKKIREITVIGAGLTGLEAADALHQRGLRVTIIEKAPHILPALNNVQASEIIAHHMKRAGIIIHTNTNLTIVPKMVTVLAMGTIPAIDFLHNTVKTSDGIITNAQLQTSDAAIYAGGDCAILKNALTGEPIRNGRWTDAIAQGTCAAEAMLGMASTYPGIIPQASSIICGLHLFWGGITTGSQTISSILGDDGHEHLVYDKNNTLKGCIVIGNAIRASELRKTIRNQL